MISKPLDQIRLPDLQAVVGNARESKTLEFKQALPAKNDKEVIQFLAAVSALANTAGGDLLIGVTSDDGIATAIPGVPKPGFDEERLRLEQLLADNIEPRISSVAFQSVDCGNGNHVIIIRVQRSWLSPHRVTKNDKFYGRNSDGKYPLDVSELRNAFVLGESAAQRIRAFRQERLLKIAAGNTPGVLAPSTSMVLHVIPLPSFANRRIVNVAHELSGNPVTLPVPLGSQGVGHGVNLDGVYIYSGPSLAECHGYGLLFRDCSIEGVKQLSQRDGNPYLAARCSNRKLCAPSSSIYKLASNLMPGFLSTWRYPFATPSPAIFNTTRGVFGQRPPPHSETTSSPCPNASSKRQGPISHSC
jgi:hypothetical protein